MKEIRVFVLDHNRQPLMPCHPAKARRLLKAGKASILRRYPFTIILHYTVQADNQPVQAKVDPGSRTTGLVLMAETQQGKRVVWAGELQHRGQLIKARLQDRREIRRRRRHRKTRYRPPRFLNRRRPEGWLPPSLHSRVENICTWLGRLCRFAPVTSLSMELVRFDTQVMQDPEIVGMEYQQGELVGYEVREYLLEKWDRRCVYCGAEQVPLEVEHIVPRARGGSNRVSNLTLACNPCNQKKGKQTAEEFGYPAVQAAARNPLKDAAVVNAARWALYERLVQGGLPVECGSGGRTKYNRMYQGYPKAHWIDAACVGLSGEQVQLNPELAPLLIKAVGHGRRQKCSMNKYGFPRQKLSQPSLCMVFKRAILCGRMDRLGKWRCAPEVLLRSV